MTILRFEMAKWPRATLLKNLSNFNCYQVIRLKVLLSEDVKLKNVWIVEVLKDVQMFADMNNLQITSSSVRDILPKILNELAQPKATGKDLIR